MADYFGAAEDLVSGVGKFVGSQMTAAGAQTAANSYASAARLSLATTNIKEAMVSRNVYQVLGGMKASAGASGVSSAGGSVQDLIRDSARQGAITKAVVGMQGDIDYNSLMAQSSASAAQAKASSSGGTMSAIGSIIGIAGMFFSDDRLKEDVTLIHRRNDGVGIYTFRYAGTPGLFQGAMASDVEKVRPDAIIHDDVLGFRRVDYGAIGVELKKVA